MMEGVVEVCFAHSRVYVWVCAMSGSMEAVVRTDSKKDELLFIAINDLGDSSFVETAQ